MSALLDELYFQWLYGQVADPTIQEENLTYWNVLRILYKTEFVWVDEVVNDENRIGDGKALRTEFVRSQGWNIDDVDSNWIEDGCSMLELMVGLARRLEFLADGTPHYWFWVLMTNIGLAGYNDKRRIRKDHIDDILNRIIFRNYQASGLGGFFPLQNPGEDQRDIELWAQMNEYVQELQEWAG
jgi:hypothetical protein